MTSFHQTKVRSGALRYLSRRLKVNRDDLYAILCTRQGPASCYYKRRKPKKKGFRVLTIPETRLKMIQRAILDEVLSLLPVSPIAHGSIEGRSVITNAIPHMNSRSQISFDLEKAFDRVSMREYWYDLCPRKQKELSQILDVRQKYLPIIMRLMDGVGTNVYRRPRQPGEMKELEKLVGKDVARLIAMTDFRRKHWYHLPQGSPTSSDGFNLICAEMDRRLIKLAENVGGRVTRYVDNIDFTMKTTEIPQPVINAIRHIIEECGFSINHTKTVHIKNGNRQGVPLRLPGVNIIDGEVCLPPRVIDDLRRRLYYAGLNQEQETYAAIRGWVSLVYGGWPERLKGIFQKGWQRKVTI